LYIENSRLGAVFIIKTSKKSSLPESLSSIVNWRFESKEFKCAKKSLRESCPYSQTERISSTKRNQIETFKGNYSKQTVLWNPCKNLPNKETKQCPLISPWFEGIFFLIKNTKRTCCKDEQGSLFCHVLFDFKLTLKDLTVSSDLNDMSFRVFWTDTMFFPNEYNRH
jgi:hypothetical protein